MRAAVSFDVDGTLVPRTSSSQYLAGFLGHVEELRRAEDAYAAGRTDNRQVSLLNAAGWRGHTHDEVSGLLAGLPLVTQIRLIRRLSRLGITGTPETAALPALLAATTPDGGGRFYGPRRPGHLSGPPAEQKLYRSLRSAEDARRLWERSEELTGVPFPGGRAVRG